MIAHKAYTVCFLFTADGSEVLLVKKSKTSFKGRLNGVGGEVEQNEEPVYGTIREIKEETGAVLDIDDLHWLGTITLPFDCKEQNRNYCDLYYYCGVVDRDAVSQQPNEERLGWMPTKELITANPQDIRFAGDGDLPYMVNAAVKQLGFNIDIDEPPIDDMEPITHFFQD